MDTPTRRNGLLDQERSQSRENTCCGRQRDTRTSWFENQNILSRQRLENRGALHNQKKFSSSCFFVAIEVSSHRALNDCKLSFFNSTFNISLRVLDGFVCVADLEVFQDRPCDLPSREKLLFLCSSFLNEDSSFEVSVDDLLQTTGYLRIKNLEVCLQLGPCGGIRRLQIDHILRGFGLVDPHHCFHRTTCTRRYSTRETHSPNPEISETGFELKFSSFFFG